MEQRCGCLGPFLGHQTRDCEAVLVARSTKTPQTVLNHPENAGCRSLQLMEAKPVSVRIQYSSGKRHVVASR